MRTRTFTATLGSYEGLLLTQFVSTFEGRKGVSAKATNNAGNVVLEVNDETPLGTNIEAVGLALAFAR